MANKDQVKALIQIVQAIADTIKEVGEVPSGVLYAQLMGKMSLENYQYVIDILKQSGKVKESNSHLLSWQE
jgi:phosphoribosylamine-glycine ligase